LETGFTFYGASLLAKHSGCTLCSKKVTPKYKLQQLRQILSEFNVLSATLIIAFLAQTLQISTVYEQQPFKKWNSKT